MLGPWCSFFFSFIIIFFGAIVKEIKKENYSSKEDK
jgi:hypothetical protein